MAAGDEEERGCGEYVSSVVAVTPVVDGKLEGVTATRWKGRATRHKAERRRSPVKLSDSTAVNMVRRPELFIDQSLSPATYTRCYPLAPSTDWTGGGTNRGGNRSSAVKLLRWQSDPLGTLYHGDLHSVGLTFNL